MKKVKILNKFLAFSVIVICPVIAYSQPTQVDSTFQNYNNPTPVTEATLNFNIGTLTDGALTVGVANRSGAENTGCTWNGVSMTQSTGGVSNDYTVDLFVLSNPTNGTQDLVCSWGSNVNVYHVLAAWWSGANQTTANLVEQAVFQPENNTNNSSTVTITTSENNQAVLSFHGSTDNNNAVPEDGETSIVDSDTGGDTAGMMYEDKVTAGEILMVWYRGTLAGKSDSFGHGVISLTEAAAGGGDVNDESRIIRTILNE